MSFGQSSHKQKVIDKKNKQTSITLKYGIKLHVLLREIPESTLKKGLNQIVGLFGGIQQLFVFITNNCDSNKIHSMYEIIRQIHVEYQHKSEQPINLTNNINTNTSFNLISNESITNICGFLTKNDIKLFKLCSRRISIVCLNKLYYAMIKQNN
eukprot:423190_1